MQSLKRLAAIRQCLAGFRPQQRAFGHIHQLPVLAGVFFHPVVKGRLAIELCPHPVPANGECVTMIQPRPAAPANRLATAVDVGSAAAVDQAEAAIQVTNLGMAGYSAGAMGRQPPGIVGGRADRAATGTEFVFNAGTTAGFGRVDDHQG